MTKNKHPHTRAERLALKKLDEKKPKADKVRRRIIQSLKDEEARHEYEQVARGKVTPSSDP